MWKEKAVIDRKKKNYVNKLYTRKKVQKASKNTKKVDNVDKSVENFPQLITFAKVMNILCTICV